jgi:predicted RNA-binding protein
VVIFKIYITCADGPELHENTQEDGDSDDTGQEQNPRSLSEDIIAPAVSDHTFRLRDGMLDEDSRMGKIYRMDTRKKVVQIPNMADQRAAKRAFKLWDQCTENSWDRRRWDNPSKTQNDEPHILGQLNLLFDILDKYDLRIGFPFPLWRRGFFQVD